MNPLIKNIGGQAAKQAARKHIGTGAFLDPKRGWAMMRDRQIPASAKVLALGIGVALTGLLVALEIPVESIIGVVMPIIGGMADVMFDGLELIIGPLLFAAMILPFVAPPPVEQTQTAPRNVTPTRR